MKVKSLIESVFLLPSLFLFGCDMTVVEDVPREWTPQLEEFVEAVGGMAYATPWETDTEGTRQVTLAIESERLVLNENNDSFSSATEGLPYMLKIDGELVDDGLIMLEVRETSRFGELVAGVRLTDQIRHVPIMIDGEEYHINGFQFGLGNDGNPTLLEVTLEESTPGESTPGESTPGESGWSSLKSINFVD